MSTLRIGTRKSALALIQTQMVAAEVEKLGQAVELVEVTTEGDRNRAPLARIGGTGVFVTALREALLAGDVDIAVHSLKDLPTGPVDGITLAAVPPREDPRDALVARDGLGFADLPAGASVGTGSPRRLAQLRAVRADLTYEEIRGNVDTRVGKVRSGKVDAVVLARAGLVRLDRAAEITQDFDPQQVVPAPGQGALAVECRTADEDVVRVLAGLDDLRTRAATTAERAVLAALNAGCSAPVGAYATIASRETSRGPGSPADSLHLNAAVVGVEGSPSFRLSISGRLGEAEQLGRELAAGLLAEGASRLIEERVT